MATTRTARLSDLQRLGADLDAAQAVALWTSRQLVHAVAENPDLVGFWLDRAQSALAKLDAANEALNLAAAS